MMNDEVTTNEIMANLNDLTSFLQEHMVTREEFSQLDQKVNALDQKVNTLDQKVDRLDQKLNLTKLDLLDAMDDKLANLKGDLVILMRKEDTKVDHLIKLLQEKSVISAQDATSLLEIRPFPQSVG